MLSADEIKSILHLRPLAGEGGLYRETYRCAETIPRQALPPRYSSEKSFCTAIYYLLTPETHSRLHRLPSDEIFHFHLGGAAEMLQLRPDGRSEVVLIGADIASGQRLQVVVPRGTWQGAALRPGQPFALMSVTVAPGFDSADYEPAQAEPLIRQYPARREWIERLTRPCVGDSQAGLYAS